VGGRVGGDRGCSGNDDEADGDNPSGLQSMMVLSYTPVDLVACN